MNCACNNAKIKTILLVYKIVLYSEEIKRLVHGVVVRINNSICVLNNSSAHSACALTI